jgi:hypothetical protein
MIRYFQCFEKCCRVPPLFVVNFACRSTTLVRSGGAIENKKKLDMEGEEPTQTKKEVLLNASICQLIRFWSSISKENERAILCWVLTFSDGVDLGRVKILEAPAGFVDGNSEGSTTPLKMISSKLSNGKNFSITNEIP